MREFSVKCNMLKSQVSVLQGLPSRMNSICSDLESVSSSIAGLRGLDNIPSEVHAKLADVEEYTKSLTDISQKTGDIVNLYVLTEREIIDNAPRPEKLPDAKDSDTSPNSNEPEKKPDLISTGDMWDLVSSAGVAGQATASLGAFLTGTIGDKTDLTLSATNALGAFGNLAKNAFATGDDLLTPKELLFGTNKVISPLEGDGVLKTTKDSVAKYVNSYIDDFDYSIAKTVGDKIKVATTWAGNILTGVTNVIDNYDEFGGEINARFVGETVIETATDIILGFAASAAATAAVAAGAAALGVAAPAVAVGVVTVGITWGVNALAKTVTNGKCSDFGDMIADGLLGPEEKKKQTKKQK